LIQEVKLGDKQPAIQQTSLRTAVQSIQGGFCFTGLPRSRSAASQVGKQPVRILCAYVFKHFNGAANAQRSKSSRDAEIVEEAAGTR